MHASPRSPRTWTALLVVLALPACGGVDPVAPEMPAQDPVTRPCPVPATGTPLLAASAATPVDPEHGCLEPDSGVTGGEPRRPRPALPPDPVLSFIPHPEGTIR